MDTEHYRDDLTAALRRIAQLEHELSLFKTDPAFERLEIAKERLERVARRRRRSLKLLPRVLIGSFVLMGAFALTDNALPELVRTLAYGLCALGAASTVISMIALLLIQEPRPNRLVELERQVRIAKGDVGMSRLCISDGPHDVVVALLYYGIAASATCQSPGGSGGAPTGSYW